MNKRVALLVLAVLFSLSACSNQQAYEAVQQSRLQECQKLPSAAAEKCAQQNSQTYEDYARNRDELLKAQFPNCMHGLLIAAARQARGDALPTMPMRWNHLR